MSTSAEITIRRAELADAAAIADIYNEAILTTTATFDTEPKSVNERTQWLQSHDYRHPVLVALVDDRVVGWASLTQWSERRAYDDTVETSFYVHSTHRGRGIGRKLKEAIIAEACRLQFHTVVARVADGSQESLHLNRSVGFAHVGTLKEVGRKFNRLLDVHVFQKMLNVESPGPKADSSTVTVLAENPHGKVATQLLHELCAELSARYGAPASPLSPDEALVPRAAFVVARLGDRPVGCGAIRQIDDATVELKRMYVAPPGRRKGIARRILYELERLAAGFNYRAIRLETGAESPEAIALYASSGYVRITPFGQYTGNPRSICFEKCLHDQCVATTSVLPGVKAATNSSGGEPAPSMESKLE